MANYQEFKIHKAIFEHHQSAFPFVKFVYVPNASKDATTGYFNKLMGLHPGAHDISLYWKTDRINVGIFEVKSKTGSLTSAQNKFASAMKSLGAYTGYGSSVKQYHNTLIGWGITPLHHSCVEPDLRTDAEKKRDAFNLYKPF